MRALVALLDEAGVLDEAGPALRLEAGAPAAEAREYRHALAALSVRDEAAHGERMRELSYLANVLVAGCSVRGRRMRPLEAAEAALATCNLGLERLGGGEPRAAATPPQTSSSASAGTCWQPYAAPPTPAPGSRTRAAPPPPGSRASSRSRPSSPPLGASPR